MSQETKGSLNCACITEHFRFTLLIWAADTCHIIQFELFSVLYWTLFYLNCDLAKMRNIQSMLGGSNSRALHIYEKCLKEELLDLWFFSICLAKVKANYSLACLLALLLRSSVKNFVWLSQLSITFLAKPFAGFSSGVAVVLPRKIGLEVDDGQMIGLHRIWFCKA